MKQCVKIIFDKSKNDVIPWIFSRFLTSFGSFKEAMIYQECSCRQIYFQVTPRLKRPTCNKWNTAGGLKVGVYWLKAKSWLTSFVCQKNAQNEAVTRAILSLKPNWDLLLNLRQLKNAIFHIKIAFPYWAKRLGSCQMFWIASKFGSWLVNPRVSSQIRVGVFSSSRYEKILFICTLTSIKSNLRHF